METNSNRSMTCIILNEKKKKKMVASQKLSLSNNGKKINNLNLSIQKC